MGGASGSPGYVSPLFNLKILFVVFSYFIDCLGFV
jgi:hypothetical protein